MNDINKKMIQALIKIRLNDYYLPSEVGFFDAFYFGKLIPFSLQMVEKICHNSQFKQNPFDQTKQHIIVFAKEKPDEFILFSSQLLQYYTIICDAELANIKSFYKMLHYIEDKIEVFGDASKNLLMAEYYLIEMYNDIFSDLEKFNSVSDDKKLSINKFISQNRRKISILLARLEQNVKCTGAYFYQGVFIDYLYVIINYTQAFLVDYELKLNGGEYTDSFSKNRQKYLQECLKYLDLLEKAQRVACFDPFFLGKHLFAKFAIKTIPEFKSHLQMLLQ